MTTSNPPIRTRETYVAAATVCLGAAWVSLETAVLALQDASAVIVPADQVWQQDGYMRAIEARVAILAADAGQLVGMLEARQ